MEHRHSSHSIYGRWFRWSGCPKHFSSNAWPHPPENDYIPWSFQSHEPSLSSHAATHTQPWEPWYQGHSSIGYNLGPRMDINQYQTNKLLWPGLLISPYDGDLFAHTQCASQQTRPTSSLGHYSFHIPANTCLGKYGKYKNVIQQWLHTKT